MIKQILTFALLVAPVITIAQVTEQDLVSCNKIANAPKRLQCLKEATGLAPKKEDAKKTAANQAPKPLDFNSALDICEARMGAYKAKRAMATENAELSNSDMLVINWPGDEGKPNAACAVSRQTKEVVYGEHNGYKITAAMFAETDREAAALKKAKSGDYTDFIAKAKSQLTANFKDPTSVLYRNLFISDSGPLTLCGELNGKNSYGAYIGFRKFYASGNAALNGVENPKDNYVFEQMYPSMCGNKKAEVQ